jgi:hypothetical protein
LSKPGRAEKLANGYANSMRARRAARACERRGAGARGRAAHRRFLAVCLCLVILCHTSTSGIADTLAQDRIARCQDLVRRQSSLAEFVPATWRVWDDPVPKKALPVSALAKIKPHDLLYDGGISGVFTLKPVNAPFQAREVFAYCSFDNLFVWLQGVYEEGVWTQFNSTDYLLPY